MKKLKIKIPRGANKETIKQVIEKALIEAPFIRFLDPQTQTEITQKEVQLNTDTTFTWETNSIGEKTTIKFTQIKAGFSKGKSKTVDVTNDKKCNITFLEKDFPKDVIYIRLTLEVIQEGDIVASSTLEIHRENEAEPILQPEKRTSLDDQFGLTDEPEIPDERLPQSTEKPIITVKKGEGKLPYQPEVRDREEIEITKDEVYFFSTQDTNLKTIWIGGKKEDPWVSKDRKVIDLTYAREGNFELQCLFVDPNDDSKIISQTTIKLKVIPSQDDIDDIAIQGVKINYTGDSEIDQRIRTFNMDPVIEKLKRENPDLEKVNFKIETKLTKSRTPYLESIRTLPWDEINARESEITDILNEFKTLITYNAKTVWKGILRQRTILQTLNERPKKLDESKNYILSEFTKVMNSYIKNVLGSNMQAIIPEYRGQYKPSIMDITTRVEKDYQSNEIAKVLAFGVMEGKNLIGGCKIEVAVGP